MTCYKCGLGRPCQLPGCAWGKIINQGQLPRTVYGQKPFPKAGEKPPIRLLTREDIEKERR
jgi:hypothetical protein